MTERTLRDQIAHALRHYAHDTTGAADAVLALLDAQPAPAMPDDVAGLVKRLREADETPEAVYTDPDSYHVCAEAADALKAQAAVIERLQGKLRMIVSHATMGTADGEGQSTNDICVQITDLRNELYQDGKAAEREACAKLAEVQFDERGRSRAGHHSEMDWTDGYLDATKGVAAAIRALGSKEGQ